MVKQLSAFAVYSKQSTKKKQSNSKLLGNRSEQRSSHRKDDVLKGRRNNKSVRNTEEGLHVLRRVGHKKLIIEKIRKPSKKHKLDSNTKSIAARSKQQKVPLNSTPIQLYVKEKNKSDDNSESDSDIPELIEPQNLTSNSDEDSVIPELVEPQNIIEASKKTKKRKIDGELANLCGKPKKLIISTRKNLKIKMSRSNPISTLNNCNIQVTNNKSISNPEKNSKAPKLVETENCIAAANVGNLSSTNYTNDSDRCKSGIKVMRSRKLKKISDNKNLELINSESVLNNSTTGECPGNLGINMMHYLIAPLKNEHFFEMYWEKEYVHVNRNNPAYYHNLLTSESLDKMLRENPLYYTRNVDVVTYENGARQTHNPEGRAIPASVWDYYSNGCSIRILNPQTYSHKIHALVAALQEYFGTMVGANVYLTPPGSQGFAPHYDDIEAFVLQLEGRKHWKIYSPKSKSELLPRYSSPNLSRDNLGSPTTELTLEAGDLLYFPRGFIHEACTDNEAHSLHITVSAYQNTAYVDLLERLLPEALRIAASDDVEYREGLPLNYLKVLGAVNAESSHPIRNTVVTTVQRLISRLVNYAPVDWAVDQMGRKFMHEALPPVLLNSEKYCCSKYDGEYLINGKVQNRVEFGLDTMVRLVRYHSLRLSVENETCVKLYYCSENARVYHGEEEQCVEVDSQWLDVVRELMQRYPNYVSIENLPCQNEVDKIGVIGELWEMGLIVTEERLETCDE